MPSSQPYGSRVDWFWRYFRDGLVLTHDTTLDRRGKVVRLSEQDRSKVFFQGDKASMPKMNFNMLKKFLIN